MQIGNLDRRVTFQTANHTPDSTGYIGPAYADAFTVWAEVVPQDLRNAEPFVDQTFNPQQVMIFRVRYRTDIDTTMRILHNNEIYDIEMVVEIGRREGLEIVARALVVA